MPGTEGTQRSEAGVIRRRRREKILRCEVLTGAEPGSRRATQLWFLTVRRSITASNASSHSHALLVFSAGAVGAERQAGRRH